MSWDPLFISALESRTRNPIYVLERLTIWGEPGSSWSCYSTYGTLRGGESRIGVRGVTISGQALDGYGWTTTMGAWSAAIVGDPSVLFSAISRGTILSLKVGFSGLPTSAWARVAVGSVKDIRQQKGQPLWIIECVDFFSSFKNRPTIDTLALRLFDGVPEGGTMATLTSNAAVGASSYSVSSTAGFMDVVPAGGIGAMLVQPSGGSYYRLFSNATGTTVTISDPSTTSVMGTTDTGASSGDPITLVAYLSGDPMNIARKILVSTGLGWSGGASNGAYDVYPESWGLAIPDYLIDHADTLLWQVALSMDGGGTTWKYPKDAPEEDAIGWLSGWLSAAGIYLAMRQGCIVVRCAQNTQDVRSHRSGVTITDADIEEVEEYSAWDYGHDTEAGYGLYKCYGNQRVSTLSTVATLPAGISRTWDVSDRLWDDPFTHARDLQLQSMDSRLTECSTKIPERLDLRCAGLRLAQCTIGDLVEITTRRAWSRSSRSTFFERQAMVIEVSPDWDGGRCKIALTVYPASSDAFER